MKEKKHPLVAVDAVICHKDSIILIKRKNPPFKNQYALPGGFIEYGETSQEACLREAKEETGLEVEIVDLVGVYSKPDRDPRGHVISIAYLCKPKHIIPKAGSDAIEASWVRLKDILEGEVKLAFDHQEIIKDAVEKINKYLKEDVCD